MFSEFEKNVFRRREHEQFFRDGKIKLCDSDGIGRSIVYDDGKTIVTVAKNVRPCFRAVHPCIVIFKAILDSRKNAVHIAVYDESSGFFICRGHLTAENEATYVTPNGEIYKLDIYSRYSRLITTVNKQKANEAMLFEDYFSVPNSSKSMLPYDFYSYDGKRNDIEHDKHLGSIILFTMYLYLRNSPKEFSDKDDEKEIRNDLLFEHKILSYERITELIDYLKNQNNYNDVLGDLFENTVNLLKSSGFSDEMLTAFFDKLFALEHDYSDDDEKKMLALDPLGSYFERRYQAEKHHKVGKYFMALDKIADVILCSGNISSILSNYKAFAEIANATINEWN